jgi:hypothetical protein
MIKLTELLLLRFKVVTIIAIQTLERKLNSFLKKSKEIVFQDRWV